MAITHSGGSSNAGSSGGPASCAAPAHAAGDILIAVVSAATSVDSWPDGWNVDFQVNGTNAVAVTIGHKKATSAEPASYSWPITGATWGVLIDAYNIGAFNQAYCVEDSNFVATAATATTVVTPAITTQHAHALLVHYAASLSGGPAVTWPAGVTSVQNTGGQGEAWEDQVAAGVSSTRTATFAPTSTNRLGVTIGYFAVTPPSPITHTVSGSGTISLSAPVAISLALTGIPSSLGTGRGNPTRYFEMGNIAWGDANGYLRNYYLQHAAELILAPFQPATLLAYSLASGITAVITELFNP